MSVSPGTVVGGKYRLLGMLGKGGMGAVYAARHVSLDAVFAIKFLTPGVLEQDEAQARFKREARAAATLTNEHVARVCDVGVHGDELYIVMEHLEGTDLGALVKARGVIPWGEAAYYAAQACAALEEAHEHGIIHRDVKLANLFITQRVGMPFLKVLDFGIAKTMGVGDMTRTAAMLGSPKYMSPEQMNDPRTVDGRSDIWSLGVVLYRLVSGQMPFEAETLGRICMLIVNEPPAPIPTLRPDVPPGLVAVIERCLEKNRERRFQTVAELAAALAPFVSYAMPAQASTDRISSAGAATGSQGRVVVRSSHPSTDAGNETTWSSTESSSATQVSAAAPPLRSPPRLALAAAAGILLSLAIIGPTVWWRAHSNAAARDEASASPASASPVDAPAEPASPSPVELPALAPPPEATANAMELPATAPIPSPGPTTQPVALAPSPALRRPPPAVRPSPEPSRSSRRKGFELPDDRR